MSFLEIHRVSSVVSLWTRACAVRVESLAASRSELKQCLVSLVATSGKIFGSGGTGALRNGSTADSTDRQRRCFRDCLERGGDNAETRETLSGDGALYYPEPARRVSYKKSVAHGRWAFSDDYSILKVKYNTWGDDDFAGEYVFRRSGWTWTYIYYGDAPIVQGFPVATFFQ